ncbi:MAG: Uma2 family endonuclease [Flammeovirgaceae bacterium]|nr:Uma2 family endonuclease [Flammeovirgaceae bacterium]
MNIITDINALDLNKTYSYADYLRWQFEERLELIKGKIFPMSPAPNLKHQKVAGDLYLQFGNYLKNRNCRVFFAPFDVRLIDRKKSQRANKDIYTVVQPDLCVVCDSEKLDEKGCLGAPDLIIEILSKGNSKKEMKIKYELYEEVGVKEYWVVVPYEEFIHQFVLNEMGKYELKGIFVDGTIQPFLFPDLSIEVEKIFEE